MKLTLKPVALAMLVATTPFAGLAYAQAQKAPVAPVVQPAPAAIKAPIPTKAPEDWIVYDDATFTPVVDKVSRHLDAARKALDANDNKKAAVELRAVADALKAQSKQAAGVDKTRAKAEITLEHDTVKRMQAAAHKVDVAAAAVESGKIKTKAELDKAINKATRADMDRRWLVTDVTAWYPVSAEPQRNFTNAVADFGKKDYKAAATDIRKGTSFMRLEAARATGPARQELNSTIAQLDKLAASVEKGSVKNEKSMDKDFARADHALALEYRSQAAESWTRKEYNNAGYELKAAAQGLESAAGWVGGATKTGASAVVTDTRALGDKLASGATWTRDEVANGFTSLGNGINTLGQKIGITKKASPFDIGP